MLFQFIVAEFNHYFQGTISEPIQKDLIVSYGIIPPTVVCHIII